MTQKRKPVIWLIPILLLGGLILAFWSVHKPATERLQGQIEAQNYSVSSKDC